MSTSTSISVPYQSCNHQNLTLFDLSAFKLQETIYIGGNNGKYVNTFIIDGLFKLRGLQIATGSFNGVNGESVPNPSKSFHVVNCKELKTIEIGGECFRELFGEFELSRLPKLESITIDSNLVYDNTLIYANLHFFSIIIEIIDI